MGKDQHKIEWREGVPVSSLFDDPFYSLDNGLAETRYVFLQGNQLPERFCDGFHVAELGFGTGLNFLTTLLAFRQSGCAGKMFFTTFEAFPVAEADMRTALLPYPELPVEALFQRDGADYTLTVVKGDVRVMLPHWQGRADAWFLDGFAPAKNPEMWGADVLAQVAAHTAPGGTFATYTAVGDVRRALAASGFIVERIQGFGRKRHMTKGRLA